MTQTCKNQAALAFNGKPHDEDVYLPYGAFIPDTTSKCTIGDRPTIIPAIKFIRFTS